VKNLRMRKKRRRRSNIIKVVALLSLLMAFIAFSVTAAASPLRVFYAEGDEIAALKTLEDKDNRYILLEEVSNLFSGTSKYERFRGRMTVTMKGKRIVFTLGQNQLTVDDKEYSLPNPATSIAGKVAISVDFLTEVLPIVINKRITLDREDWTLHISRESLTASDEEKPAIDVSPESASPGFRVIIDPGHGGYDAGAISKTGLMDEEKELTLKIARQMKTLLTAKEDINIYLTRSMDTYITSAERVSFANKLHGHLYLSIHLNWSPSKRSRGFRVYVNSSQAVPAAGEISEAKQLLPRSKKLAQAVADGLKEIGLPGMEAKEVPLAGMNDLAMPGVLVEILYLSNPQDLVILSQQNFVDSVSRALCNSILKYRGVLEDKISFGTMSKM